ncbi:MaoC family dehydratase [soil metagenome]
MPGFDEVAVGDALPAVEQRIEQTDLVRYAGASGDFNPLHWEPEFAAKVSPTGGIIAHGMLNMGLVSRVVTAWAGGPERVRSLSASFRAPCPVGSTVTIGGEVVDKDDRARTAILQVWVTLPDGAKVINRRSSRAVVQLD